MNDARWHAAYAWLPGGLARDVTLVARGGRFVEVTVGRTSGDLCPNEEVLPGITFPGFANAHSHAFHRALRGRTQGAGGSFWTWREAMYALAGRLDPDRYLALARATYAEMALAGVTTVGEFHYLHHGAGGRPYDDPNAMGEALITAAADAGIRITLLDACYLAGGLTPTGHLPLEGVQRRFGDGHVDAWAGRFAGLRPTDPETARIGAAIHSVRAVPSEALAVVAEVAGEAPLHVHVSEQPAENEACRGVYGLSPTALLHAEGVLGASTTAVHATHASASDIATLGGTATAVCLCPSTEADLGDGIGPARALLDAGSPLCLGSDQHAVIDLLAEARSLETNDRLASGERGRFGMGELVEALCAGGQASLGWHDAGVLAVGARADLVSVRLDSVRTAGISPAEALVAAGAADVDTVVVDGVTVVKGGQHVLGDVAGLLAAAIEPLWTE